MKKLLSVYTQIFARPRFRKLNESIAKLGLKGLGLLYSHEPHVNGELFFLKKIIKEFEIDSIFDVGANKGSYAKQCIDLGFKGDIHCFEPHPKTYDYLKVSLENFPVRLHKIGFSNIEGTGSIFDHMDNDGSEHASLFEGVIKSIHKDTVVKHEISITTIDAFILKNDIGHIGLLKIDTEGNEFNVLRGAQKALEDKRIDIIHFEFNEMNTISRFFMKDFLECLHNYNMYRLLPKGFLKIKYESPLFYEIFSYQNIVGIRKDIDKEIIS